MDQILSMAKDILPPALPVKVTSMIGLAGGAAAALFGGWSAGLVILVRLMCVDYVTGLIVAGVFHRSEKTVNGRLESRAGWKGLIRKGVTLLIVLVSAQLDGIMGTTFVRDSVVIAFIVNELLSIVENAGLMGIPIPDVITKCVEVLKEQSDSRQDSKKTPDNRDMGEDRDTGGDTV